MSWCSFQIPGPSITSSAGYVNGMWWSTKPHGYISIASTLAQGIGQMSRNSNLTTNLMNNHVKIDKNVPLPTDRHRWIDIVPLDKMQIGDSCIVTKDAKLLTSARSSVYRLAKQLNITITVRYTSEGVRVWRIA